jgi:4-hydroxybutyrate dehydrogenase
MIDGITRFAFPTTVSFGPGAIQQLPEVLQEFDIHKPLLVTDPVLKATDVYGTVEAVLRDAGTPFALSANVRSNPPVEDVEGALAVYRAHRCDGVIGLGGGSTLDAAKVMRVLVGNEGPLTRYDVQTGGNSQIAGPLPPMVAGPTTAGTGSEVGRCSVITDLARGRKFLVCHPQMMPAIAILDPELTVGLPPMLTAATGMDAFVHCLESLTAPIFHPMCDAIAEKGIELVAQYLERAVKHPDDIEARGYMMIAAMMGAVAFQKDLGVAHSLSHALSAVCGLPHGLANAICMVPAMKFNREVSAAHYARVARCFGIDTFHLSDLEAADQAIEAVADLNRRIGITQSLAELGVKEEQFPELVAKALVDPCHQTNPRPCSEEDLLSLYRQAYAPQR